MNKFIKIISTIAFTYWWLAGSTVFAQTDCASRLMPMFTTAQANGICGRMGDVILVDDLIINTSLKGVRIQNGVDYNADQSGVSGTGAGLVANIFTTGHDNISMLRGTADTSGAFVSAYKSRSTDGTANTIVTSGDGVFELIAYGANGTGFDPLAKIQMASGGTPGASADMPGKIVFSTTAEGSGSLTTALTIEPDQDLLMTGDLYLADGQNLGFVAANGANTACDTTCTGGCIMGYDAGTSAFVGCGSALADSCTCTK